MLPSIRSKSKWAITVLIILLAISLLLMSCSKSTSVPTEEITNEEIPNQENEAPQTDDQASKDDPFYIEGGEGVTLTYWVTMDDYQSQYFTTLAEHPFYQWLEEKTGVKVEFIHPTWEQQEQQLTLMISSGEFYDILGSPWYPGGPQAGIDEGCFVDLRPYLDKYMPNYKKALFDEGNEFNDWEWSEKEKEIFTPNPQTPSFAPPMHTFNGEIWGVTQIWRDEIPADGGPIIRADWLEELNLEMPETLDELEMVLRAFRDKGVYAPMSLPQFGYSNVFDGAFLLSAFETGGYFDLAPDGKTVEKHSFLKDEFREYLELMRDWYAEGYIDPDFMNSDGDTLWSRMLNDELGIWLNYSGSPELLKEGYTGEQEFIVKAMPLPRKTKDQRLRARRKYISEPYVWMCLTTSCEHPEVAAQWMDKHFEKEAILRQSYGIEGVHYEWVDGVPVYKEFFFTDEETPWEVKESIDLYHNGPFYYSTRAFILRMQGGDNTKLGPAMEAFKTWEQNADLELRIPYTVFADDDYGEMEAYMTEVETYAHPMIIKFITGKESIEEKWDEFVQTCIDLGIDKAREIWQTSYSKMIGNMH